MAKIRRKRIFEDDQQVQQQIDQQAQNIQQPQQNQQQNQQQQPQQNQQQQPQQNQYAQKVLDILKKMENSYWIMSVNLPEEIQKEIPDFKQGNTMADPIIKLWNDFKAEPDQTKFNAFIDSFKNFGNPVVNASTNQQNINAGLKAAYSFNKKLMENLNIANKRKYYTTITEDYFDKSEFTLF